jgi:hypothetical protein
VQGDRGPLWRRESLAAAAAESKELAVQPVFGADAADECRFSERLMLLEIK